MRFALGAFFSSALHPGYANTYKDFTYNDFTYNINKCDILYMFFLFTAPNKSVISKARYK
jgi:hypothetical protein